MSIIFRIGEPQSAVNRHDEVLHLKREAVMRKLTKAERASVFIGGKRANYRKKLERSLLAYLTSWLDSFKMLDRENQINLVARLKELKCD